MDNSVTYSFELWAIFRIATPPKVGSPSNSADYYWIFIIFVIVGCVVALQRSTHNVQCIIERNL